MATLSRVRQISLLDRSRNGLSTVVRVCSVRGLATPCGRGAGGLAVVTI